MEKPWRSDLDLTSSTPTARIAKPTTWSLLSVVCKQCRPTAAATRNVHAMIGSGQRASILMVNLTVMLCVYPITDADW